MRPIKHPDRKVAPRVRVCEKIAAIAGLAGGREAPAPRCNKRFCMHVGQALSPANPFFPQSRLQGDLERVFSDPAISASFAPCGVAASRLKFLHGCLHLPFTMTYSVPISRRKFSLVARLTSSNDSPRSSANFCAV